MELFNLEDVFVTEGVPRYTFVPPPNYYEILVDVRKRGKPVIIEGQSGTGKTTAIKSILDRLGERAAAYLTARDPNDLENIIQLAQTRAAGLYVIDDFHRLEDQVKAQLADIAKVAAEQEDTAAATLPKLVIIGINQVGSDLIQLVQDIAKRTGIHRIRPGTQADVAALVEAGCRKMNIVFTNPETVFAESQGDYWLAQQFCQSICLSSGIDKTIEAAAQITIVPTEIRARVVERLKNSYYPAVKEFCRGQRFRPSNDPYFKLLRTVGQQENSVVDLNELANAFDEVRGSINNIKERRLSILLETKPMCKKYFYYNLDTKNFAIEDPALFYFIKHLDWDRLRVDCGFRNVTKDREWDVAISFAGENRELAEYIAISLDLLDMRVFYDKNYEDNYLGRLWSDVFKSIYSERSSLVICLLDSNHKRKIWPTFERECFQPRVADGEVIPIILDDTIFVGLPKDLASIRFNWDPSEHDWRKKVDDSIIVRLIDRLDMI
jgi:hypothetical protein